MPYDAPQAGQERTLPFVRGVPYSVRRASSIFNRPQEKGWPSLASDKDKTSRTRTDGKTRPFSLLLDRPAAIVKSPLNMEIRMHKDFLNVLAVDDVISRLLDFAPLPAERRSLADLAAGSVVAETLIAPEDLPPANRSGMDGYAVRAADLFGASEFNPVWLDCVGEIAIDRPPCFTLEAGQCAAIVTGGHLPDGADAVIMVEHTKPFGAGVIEMRRSVAPGEYVMFKGEDATAGQPLLTAGTLLRAQEIGLLAAVGMMEVPVIRRPRVSLLSTGDELVPPGTRPEPGQIRDVNTSALAAMIAPHAEVTAFGIAPDRLEPLKAALDEALQGKNGTPADVVFLSGGSSIGVRDLTLEALQSLGDTEILCHGVALSPGKPLILARCRQTLVWGLPGQVASAQVVMLILGLPFLRHLAGHSLAALRDGKTQNGTAFDQRRWTSRRTRASFPAPCPCPAFPGSCARSSTPRASSASPPGWKGWRRARPWKRCFSTKASRTRACPHHLITAQECPASKAALP